MKCPHCDTLVRKALGELPDVESALVGDHLDECPRCREELNQLEALLEGTRAPSTSPISSAAFVEGVVARVMEHSQASAIRSGRPGWRPWAIAAGVALVASAAVVGIKLSGTSDQQFAARGGQVAQEAQVGAELLLLRNDKLTGIHHDPIHPTDAFAVRTYNLTEHGAYFMAFAVDASGDVHWLFPAWLDPTTDPGSLPMPALTTSRVTTEVAAPLEPAEGPLLLVTIVTDHPVRVRQVEEQLRGKTARDSVEGLLEGKVRTWTASWEHNP